MADAENSKEDTLIELKVSINKTLPATPGDKHVSKIMESDQADLVKYELCLQGLHNLKFPLQLKNNTIVYKEEEINKILDKWNGKEPISVVNRFCDYDIVPYADLAEAEPPLWHVYVNKGPYKNEIPLVKDIKSAASPSGSQKLSTSVSPSAPMYVPHTGLDVEWSSPAKEDKREILVRIDAFLSFDLEYYSISPCSKWREGAKEVIKEYVPVKQNANTGTPKGEGDYLGFIRQIMSQIRRTEKAIEESIKFIFPTVSHSEKPKESTGEYARGIYNIISRTRKTKIKSLIDKQVISYRRKRLTLDNIGEGSWLLPIYVCNKSDKGTKELLAYVNVIIEWTSEKAKTGDETGQQASKTADADKKPSASK